MSSFDFDNSISYAAPSSSSSKMDQYRAAAVMGGKSLASAGYCPSSSGKMMENSFAFSNKRKMDYTITITGTTTLGEDVPIINNKIQRLSPCEERPCFLTSNHFYAKQSEYKTIVTQIELALSSLVQQYRQELDFFYCEDETQWRMMYANGSDSREIHVNCYWDSNENDHVIEMNRVRGDGLNGPSLNTFYEIIRQHVQGKDYVAPVAKVTPGMGGLRRPMMLGPPPLKRSSPVSVPMTPVAAPVQPELTPEQLFMKGVQPILSMSTDSFYEPRLQAAKALCDISQRDVTLLSSDDCKVGILTALESLVKDEFEDVRLFAIMACSMYAKIVSYQLPMSEKYDLLHTITGIMVRHPTSERVAFETSQIRRRACSVLVSIANDYASNVRLALAENGIDSLESLRAFNDEVKEERLIEQINQLEYCF